MEDTFRDMAKAIESNDQNSDAYKLSSYMSFELPLGATERLAINIGAFDKFYDGINDVNIRAEDSEGNLIVESGESDPVEKDGDGLYSFVLDGSFIENPMDILVTWTWRAKRLSKTYTRSYKVLYYVRAYSPTYYSMSEDERSVVRAVQSRFADLFDNTLGRSRFNFFEQAQTSYGIETVANMARTAVNVINSHMTPSTGFVLSSDVGKKFPRQWFGVLETATYIELLRHAIRSYVEQPAISGGTDVPYADRRDYMQRWTQVLEETKSVFKTQIAAMRRDMMNLGGVSMLASGGIFGTISASAYNAVERGRMVSTYVPVVATMVNK